MCRAVVEPVLSLTEDGANLHLGQLVPFGLLTEVNHPTGVVNFHQAKLEARRSATGTTESDIG